jgi:hypothetical protein
MVIDTNIMVNWLEIKINHQLPLEPPPENPPPPKPPPKPPPPKPPPDELPNPPPPLLPRLLNTRMSNRLGPPPKPLEPPELPPPFLFLENKIKTITMMIIKGSIGKFSPLLCFLVPL